MLIADDLDRLLSILPEFVRKPLEEHQQRKLLIEVVMDLGRRPEARFPNGPEYLSDLLISWHDLDFSIKQIGNFSGDNRSGIESTLHRISAIRNRKGNIIGLTCRVGRAIFGTISIVRDLLEKQQSLLLLGKPGVGKTTAIREIARVLADEMEKRVIIIDTSNEIAGDGDIPHPAIGRARRMQVTKPELQHQVMIEAVENHMPEVIIIDEIGTELEALAARTIAERGVQLVGTAHGNYLNSLIKNPILSDLIGGIQHVTLGDDEAKRRGSQKSILERKASPAFHTAIEIHERNSWIIHEGIEKVVDRILQGSLYFVQRRQFNIDGSILIDCENYYSEEVMIANHISNDQKSNDQKSNDQKRLKSLKNSNFLNADKTIDMNIVLSDNKDNGIMLGNDSNKVRLNGKKNLVIYAYALSLEHLESAIKTFKFSVNLTSDIYKANVILALRSHIKHNSKLRQIAKVKRITIYTIHRNTITNIVRALRQIMQSSHLLNFDWDQFCLGKSVSEKVALLETRIAIENIVIQRKQSVELLSRDISTRNLQCLLVETYKLRSWVYGEEPYKMIRIYPI
uniref:AAA+ ATPase domain-containing protein n=1 Tax=Crouania attenuata TaxID=42002 RepID=A0A4D6WS64_9FLOR|nr:hypothetical protein [Crouania attenuata]